MSKTTVVISAFIAGLLGGVSFIVACGNRHDGSARLGPASAAAQLECSSYEVMELDLNPDGFTQSGVAYVIPAGWVPFGVTTNNNAFIARCAP